MAYSYQFFTKWIRSLHLSSIDVCVIYEFNDFTHLLLSNNLPKDQFLWLNSLPTSF